MNASKFALSIAFILGALASMLLMRTVSPVPVLAAQAATPTPVASTTPMPMPMQSGMPSGQMPMGGSMGPMMQMMPMPKSAADRAYMGAMMQMHGGMMRMTMTGNADRDFLMMMIPHHQAAVAMAQTELQYGREAKVGALAKRIIAAQQSEIREMQSWLK